jgi:hypothetical protein
LDPNWLNKESFKFGVEYRSDEPSIKFGKLDFPVYLLDKQHGYKTIRELMEQHKIPKTINGQNIYDIPEKCWKRRDTRRCGIPSGEGYRKVDFIKTHVARPDQDFSRRRQCSLIGKLNCSLILIVRTLLEAKEAMTHANQTTHRHV